MAKRTLIVSLQGIGNALLSLSAAAELHESGDEVTLLTLSPRILPLLSYVPFLCSTIAAGDANYRGSIGRYRLWSELRQRRFDRAIFSFPSGRNAYRFIRLVGIKERIGHRYPEIGDAANLLTHTVTASQISHDLEHNRQMLNELGLNTSSPIRWPVLTIPKRLFERGRAYLSKVGFTPQTHFVGLHTGCDGQWVEKRWPEEFFSRLAEQVFEQYGLPALVFDGPAEPGSGLKVKRLARTPVHALDGYGDLTDAWGLLGACDLFISNDSGLMNLASASGIPTVAIFGPSEPHRTQPYGPRGRAVITERACAPCFDLGPYAGCPFPDRHCLAGVSPECVLSAADELLMP